MKILLFGANGQLGSAFQDLSKTDAFPVGWTLVGLSSKECDLSDESILAERLEREKYDLMITAAGVFVLAEAKGTSKEEARGSRAGMVSRMLKGKKARLTVGDWRKRT